MISFVFGLLLAVIKADASGWQIVIGNRWPGPAGLGLAVPFLAEPAVQVLPGRLGNLRGERLALPHYPYIFIAEAFIGIAAWILIFRADESDWTSRPRSL